MAVPDWPNTYGYNLFLYPWQTWVFGPWDLFIEHGHRLLGATVGILTIAFVGAVWLGDRRLWMRFAALAALALVIAQGVLGGMRVLLDERTLAMAHGCLGPVFFALCVALAVFTSPRWRDSSPPKDHPAAARLQRAAILVTALAYIQLLVGAQLRHVAVSASPGTFRVMVFFHLVIAAVVLVCAIALVAQVLRQHRRERVFTQPAAWLAVLVLVQIALGGASWIVKYGTPAFLGEYQWAAAYTVSADSLWQAYIVTAHVAVGSLIIGTSLLVALRSLRLYRVAPQRHRMPTTLMGAAI